MIKKALEYIVGLNEKDVVKIGELDYTGKSLHPVFKPCVGCIGTNSLTSVVTYIKEVSGHEASHEKALVVTVDSESQVVISGLAREDERVREIYLNATAQTPYFGFGNFYDAEEFNIALQSRFMDTDDKTTVLQVVGNLKEENVRQIGDDGVSQSVTAKVGITTVSEVKVPNPVTLKPYRTFLEIAQPESQFIFRMKNGGYCALFEADGGMWKLDAKDKIFDYLTGELKDEVDAKKVVILK